MLLCYHFLAQAAYTTCFQYSHIYIYTAIQVDMYIYISHLHILFHKIVENHRIIADIFLQDVPQTLIWLPQKQYIPKNWN